MFTVGQQLYFVPAERYHGEECVATVTKVGRKWVEVSRGAWERKPLRFDPSAKRSDEVYYRLDGYGCSSPGTLYLTKEDHDNLVWRSKTWQSLRFSNWVVPSWISNELLERLRDEKAQETD